MLAALVTAVAITVGLQRAPSALTSGHDLSTGVAAAIGLLVAVTAGIVGIGGPMLAVPLLVAVGSPMLDSLAAAQVQSVVIAGTGSIGYLVHGSIDWSLAVLVGVPELAGVLIGWRVARALPTHVLKRALVVALLAIAPYLAFWG